MDFKWYQFRCTDVWGKDVLSYYPYLFSFGANRGSLWGFLCKCIYPQAALVFLAGNSVVGLGSQGVNKIKKLILNNFSFSEISK
jgi:hypothetical protein